MKMDDIKKDMELYDSNNSPLVLSLKNAKPYNPKARIRRPKPLSPKLKRIARLIKRYYAKEGNSAGGNLHVVLDDDNLEKHHVLYAFDEVKKIGDRDAIKICKAFLTISHADRIRANGGYEESLWRWKNRKNRKPIDFKWTEFVE